MEIWITVMISIQLRALNASIRARMGLSCSHEFSSEVFSWASALTLPFAEGTRFQFLKDEVGPLCWRPGESLRYLSTRSLKFSSVDGLSGRPTLDDAHWVAFKVNSARCFSESALPKEHESSQEKEDTAHAMNPLQQVPVSAEKNYVESSAGRSRASAVLRGVAISPQKLNLFARLLRGLHIEDALIQCRMHHKKAAKICEKVLLSARANAINNHGLSDANLKVDETWVGKGRHLKRVAIHGRGRSSTMLKYRSHLTIILKEEAVRRRTRIIPMLAERFEKKMRLRMRSSVQSGIPT